MHYLKIVRPINLLLIAVMMCLVKFGFLSQLSLPLSLDTPAFVALLLATVFLAAAGNVINDIFDQETDAINKPKKCIVGVHISEKNAAIYYVTLNMIGVLLGFYVANAIGRPGFALVFILTSALLYWYASQLKRFLILGNLLVSFLVGFTVILLLLFDLVPSFDVVASNFQIRVTKVLLWYACFAFIVNFIREIVKDIIDINGDIKAEVRSLPIVLGRQRATQIVFFLAILFLILLVYMMYSEWYEHSYMTLYILFLVIAPLLFFIVKSYGAKKPKDYFLLSLLLKFILFTGIGSILFYPQLLSLAELPLPNH